MDDPDRRRSSLLKFDDDDDDDDSRDRGDTYTPSRGGSAFASLLPGSGLGGPNKVEKVSEAVGAGTASREQVDPLLLDFAGDLERDAERAREAEKRRQQQQQEEEQQQQDAVVVAEEAPAAGDDAVVVDVVTPDGKSMPLIEQSEPNVREEPTEEAVLVESK